MHFPFFFWHPTSLHHCSQNINWFFSCVTHLQNLIDLAGSESSRAETTGVRRKEGSYINKSLLTLGTVGLTTKPHHFCRVMIFWHLSISTLMFYPFYQTCSNMTHVDWLDISWVLRDWIIKMFTAYCVRSWSMNSFIWKFRSLHMDLRHSLFTLLQAMSYAGIIDSVNLIYT